MGPTGQLGWPTDRPRPRMSARSLAAAALLSLSLAPFASAQSLGPEGQASLLLFASVRKRFLESPDAITRAAAAGEAEILMRSRYRVGILGRRFVNARDFRRDWRATCARVDPERHAWALDGAAPLIGSQLLFLARVEGEGDLQLLTRTWEAEEDPSP